MITYTTAQLQTALSIITSAEQQGQNMASLQLSIEKTIEARGKKYSSLATKPKKNKRQFCPECGAELYASPAALAEGFVALGCRKCRYSRMEAIK